MAVMAHDHRHHEGVALFLLSRKGRSATDNRRRAEGEQKLNRLRGQTVTVSVVTKIMVNHHEPAIGVDGSGTGRSGCAAFAGSVDIL